MSAVWNTVLDQGRGTKLSESPITEKTMVGVTLTASFISSHTFLIQLYKIFKVNRLAKKSCRLSYKKIMNIDKTVFIV